MGAAVGVVPSRWNLKFGWCQGVSLSTVIILYSQFLSMQYLRNVNISSKLAQTSTWTQDKRIKVIVASCVSCPSVPVPRIEYLINTSREFSVGPYNQLPICKSRVSKVKVVVISFPSNLMNTVTRRAFVVISIDVVRMSSLIRGWLF